MNKSLITALLIIVVAGACTKASDSGPQTNDAAGGNGKGGSLAKFTITGNYLYIVDQSQLKTFDISDPGSSELKSIIDIGFWVETIFPFKDKLFIGSTDGMFIFSLEDPSHPLRLGEARHVRSCDPVVANDTTSFVTLRGGSPCGPAQDGLYIYDIKNVQSPVQKSFLSVTQPWGLGLQDTVVFVCRETEGLTAVNVTNIKKPTVMYTLTDDVYVDVIPYDDLLICYTRTGLLLYDMSDLNNLVKLGNFKY
jgi:hypothetical protein